MLSPWTQYDEYGKPIGLYDAATAEEEGADRSPAGGKNLPPPEALDYVKRLMAGQNASEMPSVDSHGIPVEADWTAGAPLAPSSHAVPVRRQAPRPNPVTMAPQAPQQAQPQAPQPLGAGLPGLPSLEQMGQDIGYTHGFGNQVAEKAQLTEDQKKNLQNILFQTPTQSRLLMEQATGNYPQPLKDENGNIVHQKVVTGYDPKTGQPILGDGETVYDPEHTQVDPNHPYQQAMSAVDSARALLLQRLQHSPNQVDLTPFLAWADANSNPGQNAHLAEHYTPHTYDQAASAAMSYMNSLNQAQVNMAKEAMTSANAQKAGMANSIFALQALNGQNVGVGGNLSYAMMMPAQMQQQFGRQMATEGKSLQTDNELLTRMAGMLAQGNPSVNPTLRTQLGRYVDGTVRQLVGVLQAEGGDPSAAMGIANGWDRLVSGNFPPEQVAQYKDEIQMFLNQHQQKTAAFAARMHAMNSSLPMPYDGNTLSTMLSPYVNPYNGAAQKALNPLPNSTKVTNPPLAPGQTSAPALNIPSFEDFQKMKAAKKGG